MFVYQVHSKRNHYRYDTSIVICRARTNVEALRRKMIVRRMPYGCTLSTAVCPFVLTSSLERVRKIIVHINDKLQLLIALTCHC